MINSGISSNIAVIPPHISEKIKKDDSTWIDEKISSYSMDVIQKMFLTIIDNDALKCYIEMNKRNFHINITLNGASRSIFDNPKISKRMCLALFDLTSASYLTSDPYSFIKIALNLGINIQKLMMPNDSVVYALRKAIEKSDLRIVEFIVDNLVVTYDNMSFHSIITNPDVFLLLVERKMYTGPPIVPSFAFEENLTEFIHILTSKHGFFYDFSYDTPLNFYKTLVINNSIDAIKLIIEASLNQKLYFAVDLVMESCAMFNCEEIMDLLFSYGEKISQKNYCVFINFLIWLFLLLLDLEG